MPDLHLHARHFTDSAQRCVRHVTERAIERGMCWGEFTEATSGMLAVLSILRWERKVGRAALENMKLDLDRLARAIDIAIDEEGRRTSRYGSLEAEVVLPSGQRVLVVDRNTPLLPLLDHAEHEALGLCHNYVGTEHLLLAAVNNACPRLQDVLRSFGITADGVRQAIVDLLEERDRTPS